MSWLPWSRPTAVKDNPNALPFPATQGARRRRIRPTFLGLLIGAAFLFAYRTDFLSRFGSADREARPIPAGESERAAPAVPSYKMEPELAAMSVDYRVHTFYYSWYGNPETNKKWVHWNHRVLVDNGTSFSPPESIGSTYWPALGPYSSTSEFVVRQQFRWIRQAGIGTVCVTWWGRGESDENGERGMTDAVLPLLFKTAKEHELKISFHIEPYPGRTALSVQQDVLDLLDRFESWGDVLSPVFFVYDSYLISREHWSAVLNPKAPLRAHPKQPVMLGLIVQEADMGAVFGGAWDGGYTYFASHSFVFGSNPNNWADIAKFAKDNKKLFVPCVGPGYDDERIRPWNARNTRSREAGRYYDRGWTAIVHLSSKPADLVGITSWNEWHEGTQIEPATDHDGADGHAYADYLKDSDGEGAVEEVYLRRTRKWIERWSEKEPGSST